MCQSPNSSLASSERKRRILVVDDEPTLRLGFTYSLTNDFTFVDTASTGRQALEKLIESTYDLLILDLRMPDIDGLGVITYLREVGNRVPIVLCSAAITPCALFHAMKCGVPDFILKPVRPVDLRGVVEYVLNPPDSPISRALVAIRSGNFDSALQQIRSDEPQDHRASLWEEIFENYIDRDEIPLSDLQEKLFRSSLASIAFRSSSEH